MITWREVPVYEQVMWKAFLVSAVSVFVGMMLVWLLLEVNDDED